jgi:hypothetical protein
MCKAVGEARMISFPGISSEKELAMVEERVGKLARLLVDYSKENGGFLEYDLAGVNDAR